jgi:imidazolonepropionase-like amidohydrolase
MTRPSQRGAWALALALLGGCATSSGAADEGATAEPRDLPEPLGDPTPPTPEAAVLPPAPPGPEALAIVDATLLLGTGERVEGGAIVIEEGRLSAVGPADAVDVPEGARTVEAGGRFVTPGLIDTHSHMGVYAQPAVAAHADGNEMTDPTTPYVFAEHAFWPQDPAIDDAIAGGVTTIQVLPGSGNVIGGRAVVLKLRPRLEARAMRFPGAPYGLKMACGENPKRVYGSKGQQPMSRMGNVFKLRQAFLKARAYADKRERYRRKLEAWKEKLEAAKADPEADPPGDEPAAPPRDLGLETLAGVLEGDIEVHIHCYRADEMLLMLSLGDELGFEVNSFHHAVEAYKIADVLAERGVSASVWADWWGFKIEAYDAVEANAAILEAAGATPVVHSDSPVGIQRLNQEAAKALHAGRRLGLDIDPDQAIAWITKNPAEALGIADETGTLETGKMGDVVLWDRDPLSIYARADLVVVDGVVVFDRGRPGPRASDFDVGTAVEEVAP